MLPRTRDERVVVVMMRICRASNGKTRGGISWRIHHVKMNRRKMPSCGPCACCEKKARGETRATSEARLSLHPWGCVILYKLYFSSSSSSSRRMSNNRSS